VIRSNQAAHQQQGDQFNANDIRPKEGDSDLFCGDSFDRRGGWGARCENKEHFAE